MVIGKLDLVGVWCSLVVDSLSDIFSSDGDGGFLITVCNVFVDKPWETRWSNLSCGYFLRCSQIAYTFSPLV